MADLAGEYTPTDGDMTPIQVDTQTTPQAGEVETNEGGFSSDHDENDVVGELPNNLSDALDLTSPPTRKISHRKQESETVDPFDLDDEAIKTDLKALSFGQVNTPVHLAWKDLSWEVVIDSSTGETKKILNNICGEVAPGQVLAIMGPSGSGKTSLLRILSGLMPQSSGDILYNGRIKKECSLMEDDTMGYKGNAAFVQQTDNLMGVLTVRETFEIAARLKMSGTGVDPLERVSEIVKMLGLKSCENTIIGNVFFNGISGGQKRRVSIGVELMNQPALIFLDEPTSGLDSNSAYQIIHIAHELAELGHTVVMTIHQPSTQMYNMMSEWSFKLLLLEAGRMCYFGTVDGALNFFEGVGYPVPEFANPFDHYLDVINSQFQKDSKRSDKVVSYFNEVKLSRLMNQIETDCNAASKEMVIEDVRSSSRASWFTQFRILLYRNFINNLKDPAIYGIRLMMYMLLTFASGTLYWQVSKDIDTIQDRVSLLFAAIGFQTLTAVAGLPAVAEEKAVFVRERINGHYSVSAYWLANSLASAPFLFVIALLTTLQLHFMVASRLGARVFAIYMVNLWSTHLVCESVMVFFGSVSPHYMVSLSIGSAFIAMSMLVAGFFQVRENIPVYWLWWHYGLSMHKYSFSTMMINDFRGYKGRGWEGNDVLKQYSMGHDEMSENFLVLYLMMIVIRIILFMSLFFLNRGSFAPILQQLGLDKYWKRLRGKNENNHNQLQQQQKNQEKTG